jgi:hypothetical protein
LAIFATLTVGAAFEAARYARRSRGTLALPPAGKPAARVGAIDLFAPDVVPTREGLAFRMSGRISLPNTR